MAAIKNFKISQNTKMTAFSYQLHTTHYPLPIFIAMSTALSHFIINGK